MRKLYYVFKFLFFLFYKLLFRFHVSGQENIPKTGGVIVAANHLSFLDPPLVGISLKRRATFMARSGLWKIPLIGAFVDSFSIPVDRDTPKPSTIKEAVRRLKKGEVIVMFPEGTRSPGGDITSGKRGVATIAAMSKAAVVPALIRGTDKALPVGARCIRLKKVRISFGAPLVAGENESAGDFRKKVTDGIMEEIRKLNEIKKFQSSR